MDTAYPPHKVAFSGVQGQSLVRGAIRHWDDVLVFLILSPVAWSLISYFLLPKKVEAGFNELFTSPQRQDGLVSDSGTQRDEFRDINQKINRASKDVVVFWGSQSGRAARMARQLARELQNGWGIAATSEDLDQYDHEHLARVAQDKVVGFIVSTFGEGDPPDNATGFWEHLQTLVGSPGRSLSQLRFFVFGLGNSKYEHYNKFASVINDALLGAGAKRLGAFGSLDEAAGSEDDWTTWKDEILDNISKRVSGRLPKATKSMYEPEFELVDLSQVGSKIPHAMLAAELSSHKSHGRMNVHAVPVSSSRRLSASGARAYIHVEFDLSVAGDALGYQTGDHLAVWPVNSDQEVNLLASLFGWDAQALSSPIGIDAKSDMDDMSSLPVGSTTREALLRYSLDICGPISRQTLHLLLHFSPTDAASTYLSGLLQNDSMWKDVVSNCLTHGRVMQLADPTPGVTWHSSLFSMLIQTMPQLQPRYFSISSSPLVSGRKLSITVGVVISDLSENVRFHGLTTNYLMAIHNQHQKDQSVTIAHGTPTFSLEGHQNLQSGCWAQVHIRPSTFKLPRDCLRPIIMVATGSGIAPFLGFVQEREAMEKSGKAVGRALLLFGCRSPSEDYLYEGEWSRLMDKQTFFTIETAFSRFGPKREYVQDKIRDRSTEVAAMLMDDDASLYICGSVAMAKDVKLAIIDSFIEGGLDVIQAEKLLLKLKSSKRIQEDVW